MGSVVKIFVYTAVVSAQRTVTIIFSFFSYVIKRVRESLPVQQVVRNLPRVNQVNSMWADSGHQFLDAGWEGVEIGLRHSIAAEN